MVVVSTIFSLIVEKFPRAKLSSGTRFFAFFK